MRGSIPVRYARWDGPGRPFSVVGDTVDSEPGTGEVLVRISLATVCGSDVHTVAGRRVSPSPGVLGHEQVGTVVAIGPNPPQCVDGSPVVPGMRVIWSVTVSCGRCATCRHGYPQKCGTVRKYGHEPLDAARPLTGGFATHCLLMPGTAIVPVPADVPDRVASPAACATATVAATVAAGGEALGPGARVLVTGAGMLGLTAVAMAAGRGATVLALDPDPDRRRDAIGFGAHEVLDGSVTPQQIDVAIELSGAASAVRTCLSSLAVGGRVVLAGSVFPGPVVEVDPETFVRGLHSVVGVHNYRPADLQSAMDFLAANHRAQPYEELVDGAFGLDDVDAAFAAAAATGSAPRQAIVPTA